MLHSIANGFHMIDSWPPTQDIAPRPSP